MRKPICQMTIKDLLDYVQQVQMSQDPANASNNQEKTQGKTGGWLSLDEISSILNLDPDILNRFMAQENRESKPLEASGYYRGIHTRM